MSSATRVPALHSTPGWHDMIAAFGSVTPPPEVDRALIPGRIADLGDAVSTWLADMAQCFVVYPDERVSKRLALAGQLISQGLNLRTGMDRAWVTDWLQDPDTDEKARAWFEFQRTLLVERLGDLAIAGGGLFRAADFALPSQVGHRAWNRNAQKFSQILGGRHVGRIEFGLLGLTLGALAVMRQERRLLSSAMGRQIRSKGPFSRANRRRVTRVNRMARTRVLDHAHAEHLRAARSVLSAAGLRRGATDRLVLQAVRLGDEVCGKGWRGLVTLRELVVQAQHDPTSPDFAGRLERAMRSGLYYSHVPGREWVVSEFALARELLKVDGKTSRTTENVAVSQSGASIVPGVLASNQALLGLASHYMRPVQVYTNGIVAQSGADHRRHKGVFQDFFRKGEVLERAAFIENTVTELLFDVERKVQAEDGRFDFKTDLAFNYPIRIICDFLGIPAEDARRVQHWSEAAVRALDAGAGLSLSVLTDGNRAATQFLDYLMVRVEQARQAGDERRRTLGIIGAVATTEDLTDVELVSNLALLAFAGFETTTGLLCMGLHELLGQREQWEYLKAGLVTGAEVAVPSPESAQPLRVPDRYLRWYVWAHDERKGRLGEPTRLERYEWLGGLFERSTELADRMEAIRRQERVLGNAVEEMLRWTAPGSVIPLTMNEDVGIEVPTDTDLQGRAVAAGETVVFRKGQTVTVDIAAANRSGCPFGPGTFEAEHGEFDISRSDNTKHLSFGVTHICIGADLAVENAKRMIEGVARRFPNLELDGHPDESAGNLFVGLDSLPVRVGLDVS